MEASLFWRIWILQKWNYFSCRHGHETRMVSENTERFCNWKEVDWKLLNCLASNRKDDGSQSSLSARNENRHRSLEAWRRVGSATLENAEEADSKVMEQRPSGVMQTSFLVDQIITVSMTFFRYGKWGGQQRFLMLKFQGGIVDITGRGEGGVQGILWKEGVGDHWVLPGREGKWTQKKGDRVGGPEGLKGLVVWMLKTNKCLLRD